jgi:hypothetical protein
MQFRSAFLFLLAAIVAGVSAAPVRLRSCFSLSMIMIITHEAYPQVFEDAIVARDPTVRIVLRLSSARLVHFSPFTG